MGSGDDGSGLVTLGSTCLAGAASGFDRGSGRSSSFRSAGGCGGSGFGAGGSAGCCGSAVGADRAAGGGLGLSVTVTSSTTTGSCSNAGGRCSDGRPRMATAITSRCRINE
jgi:hypothetical protein